MIIPDINLLLYAVVTGFPQHSRARKWWEDALNSDTSIGLVHPVVFGFLRIVTNARVLDAPLAVTDALGYVRDCQVDQPAAHPIIRTQVSAQFGQ